MQSVHDHGSSLVTRLHGFADRAVCSGDLDGFQAPGPCTTDLSSKVSGVLALCLRSSVFSADLLVVPNNCFVPAVWPQLASVGCVADLGSFGWLDSRASLTGAGATCGTYAL